MATQFEARQMQVRPLPQDILIYNMDMGEQTTKSGIVIQSDDGKAEGIKPRWCRVWAIGPEQKDVKVGEWILVEHGRWTRSVEISENDDDKKIEIFRIDPDGIMLVSDNEPSDEDFGAYTTPSRPGLSDFTM